MAPCQDTGGEWLTPATTAHILAPMEGVTDAPMRALLTELGGIDYCVAEYLRVSGHPLSVATIRARVPELAHGGRTPAGVPVQVQLLGGHPGRLAETAQAAVAAGARAIDLNFGCPARTVNRHDGGAALLRTPARIREQVAAVRAALPAAVPVSAKLRLGWEDPQDVHLNAQMAAEGGAAWLTIHGRTRAQGYRPPADWAIIGIVRQSLDIPVVANGEIWNEADMARCRAVSGCPRLMLGRGLLADPFVLRRAAGLPAPPVGPTYVGWGPLAARLIALAGPQAPRPNYLLCRLKQWCSMRHAQRPAAAFERIKRMTHVDDIIAVLREA